MMGPRQVEQGVLFYNFSLDAGLTLLFGQQWHSVSRCA